MRYVPLHTSTSGFVRYLSTYQCSAVPTEYVLICTSNFKFLQVCTRMYSVCTQCVLGMYSKIPKMNLHNVGIRTVNLMHSILRTMPLRYKRSFHGDITC